MLVIASKEPFEGVIDVVKGIISPGTLEEEEEEGQVK